MNSTANHLLIKEEVVDNLMNVMTFCVEKIDNLEAQVSTLREENKILAGEKDTYICKKRKTNTEHGVKVLPYEKLSDYQKQHVIRQQFRYVTSNSENKKRTHAIFLADVLAKGKSPCVERFLKIKNFSDHQS